MRRRGFLALAISAVSGCGSGGEEPGSASNGSVFGDGSAGIVPSPETAGRAERIRDDLELGNVVWNPNALPPGITGTVRNVGDRPFDLIRLRAEYFDEDGVRIDHAVGDVDDLDPGEVAEFDVLFYGDDPQRVDSFDLSIDTEATRYADNRGL